MKVALDCLETPHVAYCSIELFRRQLKSVVVDGDDIICSAKKAREKFLAKLEARDAAAKAKAKREEERVAELKRIRGERWLPAIARQMRSK
ncbi:hypothetical protein HanPI659440_Chr15g0585791 [Helianthus annuus]|nr:hypothetical protein HanPI659440_Chr15g0585791 [Helianthus annuus]